MTLWLDAHLSPSLAPWITSEFDGIDSMSLRDLGLRHAEDLEIFRAARDANAVVMTKDGGHLDSVWKHIERKDA